MRRFQWNLQKLPLLDFQAAYSLCFSSYILSHNMTRVWSQVVFRVVAVNSQMLSLFSNGKRSRFSHREIKINPIVPVFMFVVFINFIRYDTQPVEQEGQEDT
nr:hypothetical protein Itr_chr11CG16770 [Ipomoea trifida]